MGFEKRGSQQMCQTCFVVRENPADMDWAEGCKRYARRKKGSKRKRSSSSSSSSSSSVSSSKTKRRKTSANSGSASASQTRDEDSELDKAKSAALERIVKLRDSGLELDEKR